MEKLVEAVAKLIEIFKDRKVTKEEIPVLIECLIEILLAIVPVLIELGLARNGKPIAAGVKALISASAKASLRTRIAAWRSGRHFPPDISADSGRPSI